MTRPPPWWSAHVAGLIVCQAAFWLGYWQLGNMRQAKFEPVMFGVVHPIELVLIILVLGGMVLAALDVPRWRWLLVFGCYLLLAVCWAGAAYDLTR